MDISVIYKTWLQHYWFIIPILLLLAFLKTAYFKGLFGEWLVNTLAKYIFNKSVYHLIKNVTVPTYTCTTQIDHIMVSVDGVFVIETKNMKGWIFGDEKQEFWTQTIYKNKSKFQFVSHAQIA